MSEQTIKNLLEAFAGESQANRRYLAFAAAAEKEGYPQVAKLFRAVAEAETIHAHSHLRTLGQVKSTAENLQASMAGENYEHISMYPNFIEEAELDAEENKRAIRSFKYAMEVEKIHENLYQEALDTLGEDSDKFDYYVCPICGHTHPREAPERCPVCNTPGRRYLKIS